MLLMMMSENIARNMYSNQGTINYPTQFHLVGHFRKLYHDARNDECRANGVSAGVSAGVS